MNISFYNDFINWLEGHLGTCFYKSDGNKLYILTANHVVVDKDGIVYKKINVSFSGSDIEYPEIGRAHV